MSELPIFTRKADSEIAELKKHVAELEIESSDYCVQYNNALEQINDQSKSIAELEEVISLDVKLTELAVKKRIAGNKKQWEQAKGSAE